MACTGSEALRVLITGGAVPCGVSSAAGACTLAAGRPDEDAPTRGGLCAFCSIDG